MHHKTYVKNPHQSLKKSERDIFNLNKRIPLAQINGVTLIFSQQQRIN